MKEDLFPDRPTIPGWSRRISSDPPRSIERRFPLLSLPEARERAVQSLEHLRVSWVSFLPDPADLGALCFLLGAQSRADRALGARLGYQLLPILPLRGMEDDADLVYELLKRFIWTDSPTTADLFPRREEPQPHPRR